jgi:hypothetical protein
MSGENMKLATITFILALAIFQLATGETIDSQGKKTNKLISPRTKKPKNSVYSEIAKNQGVPTTIEQLRQIASHMKPEKLLMDRMNGPQFSVDGNAFTFYQGDLVGLAHSDGFTAAEVPLVIPLARLIQLDGLRQFINRHPEADPAFWEPYFKEAEDIIEKKSLAAIASGTLKSEELLQKLNSYDSAIDFIFRESAPISFGKSHGLQRREPTLVGAMKIPVPVSILVQPRPAQILYVHETAYNLWKFAGKRLNWRLLPDNPALGGSYVIKVIWGDNVTREQLIDVKKSNMTFRINK